jgi:hypothetical protein
MRNYLRRWCLASQKNNRKRTANGQLASDEINDFITPSFRLLLLYRGFDSLGATTFSTVT